MERWSNKLAVVTGASSGIGAGIAVELVKNGMKVVGLARRVEQVLKLRDELPDNLKNNLHGVKCDLSIEAEIIASFKKIDDDFGAISVLVNNAGLAVEGKLLDKNTADGLRQTVNVNILGLVFCTREAYESMKKYEINDGHFININSVFGHYIPFFGDWKDNFNIYPPTKFAVTALTEAYRQDFIFNDTKMKISSISPGLVKSEATENKGILEVMPHLFPKDIADAVIFSLSTPPHVQIHEITIKPLGEKM
jgi:NADP+-dependent farnesol dehydrogenase